MRDLGFYLRQLGAKLSVSILLLCSPLVLQAANELGNDDNALTITVKEGETLRDLAATYLGDPNLWEEIPRYNKTPGLTVLKPGMRLKLPSTLVTKVNLGLNRVGDLISEANQNGAAIFATELIKRASELRDQVLQKRKKGAWVECLNLLKEAENYANAALKKSIKEKNVTGEAVIVEVRGKVESRKESALVWKEVGVNDVLVEGERIRTLSGSYVEIYFRDHSRLRLQESSQAVMQKMRVNVLDQRSEAKVSLVSGDIYALLAGVSNKKVFDLQLENSSAKVKVRSRKFWVSKDTKKAKFANYEGELEVSSAGSAVLLKEDQGSIVETDKKPSKARNLLADPQLLAPNQYAEIFSDKVEFSWQEVPGAKAYWLEIAADKTFKNVLFNERDLQQTKVVKNKLPPGLYYWRVASIDEEGLPSAHKEMRMLQIIVDKMAPYLLITSPPNNARLDTPKIIVRGETEPGIELLTLNGTALNVNADGAFSQSLVLQPGFNTFQVKAVDRAGNTSTQEYKVFYFGNKNIDFNFSSALKRLGEQHFLSNTKIFNMYGQTEPFLNLQIVSLDNGQTILRMSANAEGAFAYNLPLANRQNHYKLLLSNNNNTRTLTKTFKVDYDPEPPSLIFIPDLPTMTIEPKLVIEGRAAKAVSLQLNGETLALNKDKFVTGLILQPGDNILEFVLVDRAGNRTLLRRIVTLDTDPPKIYKYTVSKKEAVGGDIIKVSVKVADPVGVKRAARFVILVGDYAYNGYLKLNRSEQIFRGSLKLPKFAEGKVSLKSVQLTDYLGNKMEYLLK